jgi:hypothetical protein
MWFTPTGMQLVSWPDLSPFLPPPLAEEVGAFVATLDEGSRKRLSQALDRVMDDVADQWREWIGDLGGEAQFEHGLPPRPLDVVLPGPLQQVEDVVEVTVAMVAVVGGRAGLGRVPAWLVHRLVGCRAAPGAGWRRGRCGAARRRRCGRLGGVQRADGQGLRRLARPGVRCRGGTPGSKLAGCSPTTAWRVPRGRVGAACGDLPQPAAVPPAGSSRPSIGTGSTLSASSKPRMRPRKYSSASTARSMFSALRRPWRSPGKAR